MSMDGCTCLRALSNDGRTSREGREGRGQGNMFLLPTHTVGHFLLRPPSLSGVPSCGKLFHGAVR